MSDFNKQFNDEISRRERFKFGKNWKNFLKGLTSGRLEKAISSLRNMLQLENLNGLSFLDIGCGSGLFSLAAKKLGAQVTSFDYDPDSVECVNLLKEKFFSDTKDGWVCFTGSVLDSQQMESLGQFDIVYSWGVLHHTGNMWLAIDNTFPRVKPNGKLFISIYNKQPFLSPYWMAVKKYYNKSPFLVKKIMESMLLMYLVPAFFFGDLLRKRNPISRYKSESKRGMSVFHNAIDWIGGWPFEVAKPEEIIEYLDKKGFRLRKLVTCGGTHGCNEYVFEKEVS